jgi:hypothetical protein
MAHLIGEEGYARVKNELTWEKIVLQMKTLLEKI